LRILGLIGGTSWHSTVVYYRLINEGVGEYIGTQGNPDLILYSQNIELLRSGDKPRIREKYLHISTMLQQAGAEAMVICANTPHLVYEYVAPRIDIPILHIADATGQKARSLGLKRLGLLGNRPTMTGGFIQKRLQEQFQIETLIPEPQYLDQSHEYVSKELTQGKFTQAAKEFFLQQMQLLQQRGAQGIILGCTELPMLIEQQHVGLPLLPTTHLHIQMAVDFILNKRPEVTPET